VKTNRIAAVPIVINLVLLVLVFSPLRSAFAQPSTEGIPAVLRGHALEIVDDRGRVRAQIIITQPTTVGGVSYPEGTLYGIQILSQNGESVIRVVDKAGKETLIKPGA